MRVPSAKHRDQAIVATERHGNWMIYRRSDRPTRIRATVFACLDDCAADDPDLTRDARTAVGLRPNQEKRSAVRLLSSEAFPPMKSFRLGINGFGASGGLFSRQTQRGMLARLVRGRCEVRASAVQHREGPHHEERAEDGFLEEQTQTFGRPSIDLSFRRYAK